MTKITLEPLDDGQKAVDIPVGKTIIGRGPFLGCGDKKVSRNHAVLEVTSEGEVFLTPTHVNPCFFQPTNESPGIILKKDKPHKLVNGDSFSLLPRAFRYKVIVTNDVGDEKQENDEEPSEKRTDEKVNGTAELKSEENSKPEVKTNNVPETKSEREKVSDAKDSENEEDSKDSSSAEDLSSCQPKETKPSQNNEQKEPEKELNGNDSCESTKAESTGPVTKSEESKSETEKEKDPAEKETPAEALRDDSSKSKDKVKEEVEEKVALPEVKPEEKTKEKKEDKKETKEESKRVEKEVAITAASTTAPSTPVSNAPPERRRKKQVGRRNDDAVQAHHSQRPSTGRSPRTNRQTRQGISLEDFIASDDDEWQSDDSQPRHKKRRKSRRRDDDSGSDWEAEHKKSKKTVHKYTSGSESGSDWGTKKKKTPKAKRRRKNKRTKDSDIVSDDDDSKSMSSKPEKRVPCQYGKKCFRKSQSHLEQFSHPGDSDYASEAETHEKNASECDDNSELKECPYGANCYRKNSQHRKEYKHTKKVRPQREAAKQAGKRTKVSKENDEPDAYDLNDSFLNDDSADEYKPVESGGSEYDSSQEVQRLPKGTKNIVKAKKAKRV